MYGAYNDLKTTPLAAEAARIPAGNAELEAEGDSDDEDDDLVQVKPFEGDYFGSGDQYTAADFGWRSGEGDAPDEDDEEEPEEGVEAMEVCDEPAEKDAGSQEQHDDEPDEEDDQHSVLSTESESSSDAYDTEFEYTLDELEGSTSPTIPAAADDDSDDDRPEAASGGAKIRENIFASLATMRSRLEGALRRKIHVVRFPSAHAGAPISPSGSSTAKSGYAEYAAHLHGPPDQPYRPFTSKIDWEIGRAHV